MPYSNSIVDTQTRGSGSREDILAIWRPFADACVTGFDCADLGIVFL